MRHVLFLVPFYRSGNRFRDINSHVQGHSIKISACPLPHSTSKISNWIHPITQLFNILYTPCLVCTARKHLPTPLPHTIHRLLLPKNYGFSTTPGPLASPFMMNSKLPCPWAEPVPFTTPQLCPYPSPYLHSPSQQIILRRKHIYERELFSWFPVRSRFLYYCHIPFPVAAYSAVEEGLFSHSTWSPWVTSSSAALPLHPFIIL